MDVTSLGREKSNTACSDNGLNNYRSSSGTTCGVSLVARCLEETGSGPGLLEGPRVVGDLGRETWTAFCSADKLLHLAASAG